MTWKQTTKEVIPCELLSYRKIVRLNFQFDKVGKWRSDNCNNLWQCDGLGQVCVSLGPT